jgi:glycine/D-amino acid oxidase-like deaminating enzyme
MTPFPFAELTPPTHHGPLPAAADVVIIGGGVIGVTAGWALARAGLTVVLLEKGRIAAEQSGRNWGWIRQQGRDPAELPIAIEANRIWRGYPQKLRSAVGLAQSGVMYLAETERDAAEHADWMTHARAHDLDTCQLTRAGVAAMMPGASRHPAHGALWTASDLRAEPWLAVPALAGAAAEDGLILREGCAARALDLTAGRVTGVLTEQGPIRADRVVLAAGAWSSLFLASHGIRIPQLAVKSTVAATGPLPLVFDGNVAGSRLAFRRRADGGYTLAPSAWHEAFLGPDALRHALAYRSVARQILRNTRLRAGAPPGFPDAWRTPRRWTPDQVTPFERTRILNPAASTGKPQDLARAFAALFPAAGPVTLTASWAGMIDTMPDVVPIVDHVAALPGLTLATGMSGHGFGIGPAFGRIIADLVQGRAPGHDLTRFRMARFTDGSRIVPGLGL